MCGGGQTGLRSARVGADTAVWQWVGPWQYQCSLGGVGREGYYPPRYTPPGTHPLYPPCTAPLDVAAGGDTVPLGHAHMTVSGYPKEILGVNNAQVYRSRPHASPDARPRVPLGRSVGPGCEAASGSRGPACFGLQHPVSSIQYPVSS